MDDYKAKYTRGCDLMTIEEAAHRLGKGVDTIESWARAGYIKWCEFLPPENKKSNGQWIVKRRAFEIWCEGGQVIVQPQLVIDTPEAYDALCREAIRRIV